MNSFWFLKKPCQKAYKKMLLCYETAKLLVSVNQQKHGHISQSIKLYKNWNNKVIYHYNEDTVLQLIIKTPPKGKWTQLQTSHAGVQKKVLFFIAESEGALLISRGSSIQSLRAVTEKASSPLSLRGLWRYLVWWLHWAPCDVAEAGPRACQDLQEQQF